MRCLFLVALLVGGCDSTGLGGPCSATDLCDDGAVCDFTATDGPRCVAADGDEDGDGLPNSKDFCQHQLGGAYDEDLDGFGDDCDRCPIAPPPVEPDSDGDEVDSPCDPDPRAPGDRIVVFDGFNGGALPTNWKATPGWVFQGGEAKITPATPTEVATLTAPLALVSTKMAILAKYRVERVEAGATESNASVIGIDRRPAGATIITCGGSRVGADRLFLDTGVAGAQDSMDALFDPASEYRVALKLEGAMAQCALIATRDTGAAQAMTNGEAMSEAGLSARGASIRFSYLLAVQRGPTPPQ
ncbi:MAG: hypothetical protein ABI175_15590 [Polyangiales bacterium]